MNDAIYVLGPLGPRYIGCVTKLQENKYAKVSIDVPFTNLRDNGGLKC